MSKIKICGLSRLCDIDFVNRYKPDYIGFVFAKSKRQVTDEQAKALKARLDTGISAVGVFVNDNIEHIEFLCKSGIIDIVQLHGDEDERYIKKLKSCVQNPVIKAVRVQSSEDISAAEQLSCDMLLLDTYTKGMYGGSGSTFDHTLIPPLKKPFFVAGGLNPDNIYSVCNCGYYGLDISSGVETDGFKDENKIKQIIEMIRSEES